MLLRQRFKGVKISEKKYLPAGRDESPDSQVSLKHKIKLKIKITYLLEKRKKLTNKWFNSDKMSNKQKNKTVYKVKSKNVNKSTTEPFTWKK